MKQRSPIAVFFLSLITFGIYSIVWSVKTKNEMNQRGAAIPTAWLIIIPFISLYWYWKYSEGVEQVTGGQTSGVLSFVLLILLGPIGQAVLQSEFNKIGGAAQANQFQQPGQPLPDNSFGGPVTPGQQPVPANFGAPAGSAMPAPGVTPPSPLAPPVAGQPYPSASPTPPQPPGPGQNPPLAQ